LDRRDPDRRKMTAILTIPVLYMSMFDDGRR
jgi:hypothetical protein